MCTVAMVLVILRRTYLELLWVQWVHFSIQLRFVITVFNCFDPSRQYCICHCDKCDHVHLNPIHCGHLDLQFTGFWVQLHVCRYSNVIFMLVLNVLVCMSVLNFPMCISVLNLCSSVITDVFTLNDYSGVTVNTHQVGPL